MRTLHIVLVLIAIVSLNACTQFRCACTDGYVIDVKHSSKKVASQTCEDIEEDRQIIKQTTKCDLQ